MKRKMTHNLLLILFCVTVLFGTASTLLLVAAQTGSTGTKFKVVGIVPTRNHPPAAPAGQATPTAPFNGIQYNGGPVMNNPHGVNAYYIWYGNWSNDAKAKKILTDFIDNLGGSPWFNISTTYYGFDNEGEKDPVRNRVNFGGSITDNYSYGTAPTDNDIGSIIENSVTSGKFPADPNGVYFVLGSADVFEGSGLCSAYCAFHGYQPVTLPNLPYLIGAYIGNPVQCPSSCAAQYPVTPNDDLAADSMAGLVAHELTESATDPLGTGWINPDGNENADLCLTFAGSTKPVPNGSVYNVKLGDRLYLIQGNWVNARGGYCALKWDGDK